MPRRMLKLTLAALVVASLATADIAIAGTSKHHDLPTVSLMVGGIDKQIYLPYQLAQNLGFYTKYGVNVQLSTEQEGGVGAEDALASGSVNMAGAWYVHAIDFQQHGKDIIDVVQLSGAPGEREMCRNGSNVHSPADFAGKNLGVTSLGSGTDDLTLYLAARAGLSSSQFNRVGVGAGSTFLAAMQQGRIDCGMTTQPTVTAIEKQNVGYSAIDLASVAGVKQYLGGPLPTASVLAYRSWVDSNKQTVQKVVDALVATMHWISTHTAAQIAAKMPPDFVSNQLTTQDDYISALAKDKNQFLPNGLMPRGGPAKVYDLEKKAGKITGPVNVNNTYTNKFVITANQLLGYTAKSGYTKTK
ncbi:MAG TPA: ABC transporter substrate-binding protein [Gaiellaceae bacterium]|nr:ABC transporter substrate-binding protein [Gaiellaceae bacterium]